MRRLPLLLAAICLLAFILRLPTLFQSLWYDEMYTLIHYISAPWRDIVAGQYSPNNHVLFTLLAKLITPLYSDPALFIRLPSIVAGSLVPLALAWPLRQRPYAAILVALIVALHPWLIAFSGYARGYALLMLLSILATNVLPARKQLLDWRYALLVVATLYTHPLAAPVFVGHTLFIILFRRDLLPTFIRSAALAGVITIALYLPMLTGAKDYWSAPEKPSVTYLQFIDHSMRHAFVGYEHAGLIYLMFPLFMIAIGGYFAWQQDLLRPHLVSFAAASGLGMIIPLFLPLSGEVRAMLWLIPVYILGVTAFFLPPTFLYRDTKGAEPLGTTRRVIPILQRIALAGFILTIASHVYFILTTPAQPIRDALVFARENYPPDSRLIGVHMASRETHGIYPTRGLDDYAYTVDQIRQAESVAPQSPVVIVFYEQFLQRDVPDLWNYIQQNYDLSHRLPGRVSPAGIYTRKSS